MAEFRTGLAEPNPSAQTISPASIEPGQPQHPVFEAYMAVTSEAKLFEADLAEAFGPEEEKRVAQSMSCVAARNYPSSR